jgi:hypothetical protein
MAIWLADSFDLRGRWRLSIYARAKARKNLRTPRNASPRGAHTCTNICICGGDATHAPREGQAAKDINWPRHSDTFDRSCRPNIIIAATTASIRADEKGALTESCRAGPRRGGGGGGGGR